jgi:short-subunit dehydrogenase
MCSEMALPPPSPDSTALITGASAGIGVELARALAARGHGVTLVARRRERLDEVASDLAKRHGVRAEAIAVDLAEPAGRDRLAAELSELGLEVSVLCNNAGYGSGGPFVTLERERETQMVRLNCEAVVDLCARFAPLMVRRERGAILNVASTAAFQPLPRQAAYGASKAFVLSFTEALHQELRPAGVAVTALCPGPVRTEFADVAGLGGVVERTPSFIWDPPEKVAEAAIRGLESGKRVVIPGAINRVTAVGGHYVPRSLLLRATDLLYPVGRDRR